ncbi:MAG TPA: hypothetical protein VNT99_18730, partial [Methylomirabilota bacterium]|nr:hypothetical protein [Methylomirabilota bacterium]
FFHHPPYTKGSHDSDSEGDLVQIRQNLVPILEHYGVDLVLGGHSHCYERSYLLDGQYGLSSTLTPSHKIDPGNGREDGTGAYMKNPAQKGVIYTVAGSSGQATGGQLNHPAHFISLNQLGTMVIDVSSNRLDALFLTSGGLTNDHFTLIKRETVFSPIAVNINGDGTVSGVTNGQLLAVGQTYTVMAAPASGSVFVNWTGGVSDNSPALTFVMESNLVITANFAAAPPAAELTLIINGSGTVTGATNGQELQVGNSYTLQAAPEVGWVFANWSGGVSEISPTLNFVMLSNLVIIANFVPEGTNGVFVPLAGVFHGLFFEPQLSNATHAGFFTLKLNDSGGYNATLRSPGERHVARGQFNSDGRATNRIVRRNANALMVIWEANLQDADVISGSVSDGDWIAPLLGHRPAAAGPLAGRYTLIIPGAAPLTPDLPAGDGYATAVIDANGVVRLKGRLADGRVLVQKAAVSKNGDWPLYAPLYNGSGVVLGWMHLGDDGFNDVSGRLRWVKPSRPTQRLYPAGFAVETDAIGSRYVAPTGTDSVLQITDGLVILNGGNLPSSINPVTFGPNSKLVNNGPNTLKLNFASESGVFTGTFKEAGTTTVFPIKGAVLQRQNIGAGHARGADQSGRVQIQAAP